MISTKRRELAKITQLKMSTRSLEGNVALYDASEENLKGELEKTMAERTRLKELFNSRRAQVARLREKLAPKHAVRKSIVEDSCITVRPSLKRLVENSCARVNSSECEGFLLGYIDVHLHANTAFDGITLHFLRGTASEEGGASTKAENVFGAVCDAEVIEM